MIQTTANNQPATTETPDTSAGPPVVVVLHGLAVNSWLMGLLAWRLRSRGYDVRCWGYSTFGMSLRTLIPHFRERFRNLSDELQTGRPLSIVGHSLGAIILRGVLAEEELPGLKRVVFLSPPHAGSPVARWVAPWLRWLTPLLDELSDNRESLVNQLPCGIRPEVEAGTIVAAWDYVVAESSTRLGCERDVVTMPSRHSGLILRRTVADQIAHFLEHGRFRRDEGNPKFEVRNPEQDQESNVLNA